MIVDEVISNATHGQVATRNASKKGNSTKGIDMYYAISLWPGRSSKELQIRIFFPKNPKTLLIIYFSLSGMNSGILTHSIGFLSPTKDSSKNNPVPTLISTVIVNS